MELSNIDVLYRQCQRTAKFLHNKFDISLELFELIIKKPCYICHENTTSETYGVALYHHDNGWNPKNLVSCCSECYEHLIDKDVYSYLEYIEKIASRSDGMDYNTRTIYQTERNVGDTTKVMLLCVYDLSSKFNLQKSEIIALFKDLVNEHIIEVDHVNKDTYKDFEKKPSRKKKASK